MKLNEQKVKYYMACQFLDVEGLRRKSGLSRATIFNVIHGKTAPRPDTLRKLCVALDCSPQDILQEV